MPSYNVECSACDFTDIVVMKISEVDAWDAAAKCPECGSQSTEFRRVMRSAPVGVGGEKAQQKSALSKKATDKARFSSSGEKDDMRHREDKRRDRHQIAEAVDNVRKGAFEGF